MKAADTTQPSDFPFADSVIDAFDDYDATK
jgi:hypothetical protein